MYLVKYAEMLTKANYTTIKGEFSRLKSSIRDALKEKICKSKVDNETIMKDIKVHLGDLFSDDDEYIRSKIKDLETIHEVFEILDDHKMWNYSAPDILFDVAITFLDDIKYIMDKISIYQERFQGHFQCTLICNWIIKNPNTGILLVNPTSFKKPIKKCCSWIVDSKNVSSEPMKYLYEVWRRMPVALGKVDLIMDKICKKCIEVVWYISSTLAQTLLKNIKLAVPVFQEAHISAVHLEGAALFDSTSGIASEQVGFTPQ